MINEFNLEPILGEIIVDSGPFSVTLQFLEDNVGNEFHPTAIHDGNGCQPGKNLIQIDTDYEIYEGQVGSYYSHGLKLCSTGGATGAIVFPAAWRGREWRRAPARHCRVQGSASRRLHALTTGHPVCHNRVVFSTTAGVSRIAPS